MIKTKAERNLGVVPEDATTTLAAARNNVALIERLMKQILVQSVDLLQGDTNEAKRFFSHWFDTTVSTEEVDQFVAEFQRNPPRVVIGYPRSAAEFPVIGIVLQEEQEDLKFMDDYLGQTLEGEEGEAADYSGSVWKKTYSFDIYAQHPDIISYLYQFVKSVVVSSDAVLMACGVIDTGPLSGTPLTPVGEQWAGDNMFMRQVIMPALAVESVPRLLDPDPANIRLAGLFMDDVNVEGVQGSVSTYDPSEE